MAIIGPVVKILFGLEQVPRRQSKKIGISLKHSRLINSPGDWFIYVKGK